MKLPTIVHESWHPHLKHLFEDERMRILKNEILPNCKFYPEPKNIFRVFSMPFNKIKVVILGQDPYSKGEAIGYSFAVAEGTPIPPSLKVIADEVAISQGHIAYEIDRTLQPWIDQGVFLLNMALTVQEGLPSSHLKYWRWFTKQVIQVIDNNVENIVWMLWGKNAQSAEELINNGYILKACHPAAESYGSAKFTGCGHFTKANELLTSPINWAQEENIMYGKQPG